MPDLLFVYGTLRSHFANDWARALRENSVFLGRATIGGSIYRVGHFPAWLPEPPGTVQGELYEVPDTVLTLLDEYESDIFTRVPVALHDGREAWVYRGDSIPPDSPRIESGDFSAE